SDQSTSTAAPRSSKIAASAEYTDWMTTDTRLKPFVPATSEPVWSIPLSDQPVLVNNWASALVSTYPPPPENLYNVSKPLPLRGLPGQVTIQSDFFFNKDLEYLRYGRKSGRPALSILKMKAVYYPDVGLE
ncbi:hypothetical protein Tco_0208698, partial [Tanacetum coccineum]